MNTNIEFSAEELDLIKQYMEVSGVVSLEAAILNAIRLALETDSNKECKHPFINNPLAMYAV